MNKYKGIIYNWRNTFRCYCLNCLDDMSDNNEKTRDMYWYRAHEDNLIADERLKLGKTHEEARNEIDEYFVKIESDKYNI